jgi:hypothetical protein
VQLKESEEEGKEGRKEKRVIEGTGKRRERRKGGWECN